MAKVVREQIEPAIAKSKKKEKKKIVHICMLVNAYPNVPFETRNRVKGCSESIKTSSFDVTYAPIYDCCREFTGLSSFLYV